MSRWSRRNSSGSNSAVSGSHRLGGRKGRLAKACLRIEHLEDRRVPALLLNEISLNPPATDNPYEYVELIDTPSATIPAGTYVVDIEGDGAGSGVADFVVNVSGLSVGTSGFLVIKSPTGGHTIPSGVTIVTDAQLDTAGGGIENGTRSLLLISSPITAITEGTDYDTNNDGTLDALPGTATILDACGWTDGGAGDLVYGGVTLTQSSGTPDAGSRFLGNTTASSFAAWYNGDLAGATNDSKVYSATQASANLPAGAEVTPGAANFSSLASSSTTVVSDINPSVFGELVTFTATVTGSSGTPTGTVEFFDGATSLGTDGLDGSAQATLGVSSLTVGAHNITAKYLGDTTYATSTSPAITQTVNKANTSSVVISNNNPSNFGASVMFTATVTAVAPGAGLPTGTVEFFDGATSLGTDTLDGSGQADLSTSSLSVGSHSITASFLGDGNFNTSTSPAITQDVVLANVNTITTVVADINPSNYNQAVTFTATVVTNPSGQGTPAGIVEFFDGATSLGTDTLDVNGEGSVIVSTLTAGSHSITASYQGNATYNASTSAPYSQTVNQASTSTAVVSSLNPSIYGQPVTFTATVTSSAGTPAGTVEFFDGATSLGTDTLDGSGQGDLTINTLTIGSHSITAQYLGDTNYSGSTSLSVTQDVNALVTPAVVLNELSINQPGTDAPWEYIEIRGTPSSALTNVFVVVLEGDVGSAIGNADFVQDLSSFLLGTNGLLYIGASVGGHTIPAATTKIALSSFNTGSGAIENGANTYMLIASPNAGAIAPGTDYDTNNDGTLELPVGAVIIDTVSWVDAGAGGTVYGGVVLTQSAGTPDAAVRFIDNLTPSSFAAWFNGDLAGTDPFSITFDPAEISANFPAAGAMLTPGDHNSNATPVASSTAVVADINPTVFGETVTFTATVTVGSGTPTGTVTFKDGATTLGSSPLVGNIASLPVSNLSVGAHNITAVYSGDVTFASSASPILSQTVNTANTSGVVLSSVNPSVHGQSVTFTVTVSAVPPGAGLPTGSVEFFDGATSLGTDTLDGSGQADVTTSSLSIGSHSITAVYAGDGNFNGSTSAPLSQQVNQLVATWVGGGAGDPTAWSNPNNWGGGIVPGVGDKAIFTFAGTVSFASTVDAGYAGNLAEVKIDSTWNGFITLDSALTVTTGLDIDSGVITGNGALSFEGGTWTSVFSLVGSGGWTNTGSLTLNAASIDISGSGTFTNADEVTVQAGTPLYNAEFNNLGTIEVLSGAELDLFGGLTNLPGTTLTGGTYDLAGILKIMDANIVTISAAVDLFGPASLIVDHVNNNALANLASMTSSGSLTLAGMRSIVTPAAFSNAGTLTLNPGGRFTSTGIYTQTAGVTTLGGGTLKVPAGAVLNGGVLEGTGSILGDITNNSATVAPGGTGAAGRIRISGNYTQGASGILEIEIGGLTPQTQHDQLKANLSAALNGTMNVSLLGSYVPNNGDSFQVVQASVAVTGTFSTINGLVFGGQQFIPNYNPNDVTLVTAAFPIPPAPDGDRPGQPAKPTARRSNDPSIDWHRVLAALAAEDLDDVTGR